MRKALLTSNWVGSLLAVAIASPVVAQETRWYAGASVGEAKFKSACDGVPVSCKDHDTAWKLFGGYQFNQNFGAELGYADMGKAKANGIVSGVAVDVNDAVTAWDLVGVGSWPFGLGGRYDITKAIGARAEWQRYRKVGGDSTGKDDIDVFSVGLLFSF
jgi:OOP family OmpA-OmpF porin